MNELVNTEHLSVDESLITRVGNAIPHIFKVLPYKEDHGVVHLLVEEGRDLHKLKEEISLFLPDVHLDECAAGNMHDLLNAYCIPWEDGFDSQFDPTNNTDPHELIRAANAMGASDIHIEAGLECGRIRLRIDGKLHEKWHIPMDEYQGLINRIKMASGLDIAERRLPQDGRMETDKLDIRLNCIPGLRGEKMAMRLLHRDHGSLNIQSLGMPGAIIKAYLNAIRMSYGLILVSGPTGSGKTTTLYATISQLYSKETNILTIEDPVEYSFEGITQVQVHESIGRSFPKVLRSFLRQDPDIIMVGEIRDPETASIAVRSALTGHLVLSTIHTNSALDTVTRLTDMGIEPFLLASTLTASLAQRLLRKLCPLCKKVRDAPPPYWPLEYSWPEDRATYYEADGCPNCHYTGFNGLQAIFELLIPDQSTKEYIRNGTPVEGGIGNHSLADHAMNLVFTGITSPSEALGYLGNPR